MPLVQSKTLVQAALDLRARLDHLRFGPPVVCIYNPLHYAWQVHEEYLRRYGSGRKEILFLGMNPGPFGMVQTGVPFGEVTAVRQWLKLDAPVGKPAGEHLKRPILGWDCQRSEVSGRRLWGLFAKRFGSPEAFFGQHFVANYCPLAFLESSGCNRTPDKLPKSELIPLLEICDEHLRQTVRILRPRWVIGVGAFAQARTRAACDPMVLKIGGILHPSPASPASNRDWEGTATRQLQALGVWD